MKIGALANQLGVSIRTIRYYEERGLITALRSDGNTRHYTEDHLHRMQAVLMLANAGFSIDSIGSITKVREEAISGHACQFKLSRQIQEITEDLESQIARLSALKDEFNQARDVLHGCRNCQYKPSESNCDHCQVPQYIDSNQILRLIWGSVPS